MKSLFSSLAFTSILIISSQSLAQANKPKTVSELETDLNKITQSIDATREKMKTVKDARFLPDLYFMLAELYVDKSRYMYQIKTLKNKGTPQNEIDYTAEGRPKQQAIEIYQNILDKFPTIKELDRALFFMAHEYRELGKLDEMIKIYQRLTREYPNSAYWSESQLIIGNYFFEQKKDLTFALELYRKILEKPAGPFTPIARYKIGWCFINQGKFKEAMLSFEDVLTQDKNVDLAALPEIYRTTDIRRDALLALVWPYSEIPPSELEKMGDWRVDPLKYFFHLSNNKASYQKVLLKLGGRLSLKHRFIAAVRAFYEYLSISQNLSAKMDAIDRLYEAMRSTGQTWPVRGFVQETTETIQRLRVSTEVRAKEKARALRNFEVYARDVATRAHETAKKTHDPIDYKLAIRDYDYYIWAFPNSKYDLTMKLNMAESYFNIKDYIHAGFFYEEVAQKTRDPQKRKSYLDSALQSYATALKEPEKLNRVEILQARNGFRDVGKIFTTQYAQDRALPMIRFNTGRTHYDERDFDLSVGAFKDYLKFHPNGNQAQMAANLILDCFNQKEDYDGLIKEGTAIANNKAIASNIRNEITEIVKQAQYKKIQAKAGDFSSPEYGKKLLQFAQSYKGTEVGDKALYEAFISFKSKKDPQAYAVGEALLQRHSDSQYAKGVVSEMGKMSLLTADFTRTSRYFEAYANKYPQDPESKNLMKQSATMREFMADFEQASKDYKFIGDSYQVAKMDFNAAKWTALQSSASSLGGVRGNYYKGVAEFRLGNFQQAQSYLKSATAGAISFEEKTMSAHALYLLSMDAMKAYKSVQLVAGQEAQIVPQKAKMLENLTKQLNQVIQFGNGRWTIAALYGLGQSNKEFANFLSSAPMPAGLSPVQQQQYKTAIQQQAQKYEAGAEKYFNQCITNAEKFEVFTGFVRGCLSKGSQPVDEASEVKNFVRAGNSSPAEADAIRKKLYDDSRNLALLQQLAQVHIKAQDFAMAALILSRAHEINGTDAKTMAELGQAYLYMNDYDLATDWFHKALKQNPKEPLATYAMAALYKEYHFKNKSQTALKQAKSMAKPANATHPLLSNL